MKDTPHHQALMLLGIWLRMADVLEDIHYTVYGVYSGVILACSHRRIENLTSRPGKQRREQRGTFHC